jgi:hypothetical protein
MSNGDGGGLQYDDGNDSHLARRDSPSTAPSRPPRQQLSTVLAMRPNVQIHMGGRKPQLSSSGSGS